MESVSRSVQHQLACDAPKIHFELEALDRREARKPSDAVDRGRTGLRQISRAVMNEIPDASAGCGM